MIELRNIWKSYPARDGTCKVVARGLSAVFPAHRAVAILGRNGAGKSTLLQMISGSVDPDCGMVLRGGRVSWPVGHAGSFHPDLTGMQNVRFIARVYGVDSDELIAFVQTFAELGSHFHLPFRTYSSGMRARLAFGTSLGIRFDTYLVDEVSAVGDAAFRERSERVFRCRVEECGALVVTHSMAQVRRLCHHACVLEEGELTFHENVEEAIALHAHYLRQRAILEG